MWWPDECQVVLALMPLSGCQLRMYFAINDLCDILNIPPEQ
jgi:hypothetical protein